MEVKVSFTLVLLSFSSASGCWSQMSSLLDCYVLCVCVRVCAGVRCDFSLKPSVCWFAVCRRSSPCWSGCRKTSKPSAPSSRSCTLPLLVSRSIAFLPSYLSDILGVCSSCVRFSLHSFSRLRLLFPLVSVCSTNRSQEGAQFCKGFGGIGGKLTLLVVLCFLLVCFGCRSLVFSALPFAFRMVSRSLILSAFPFPLVVVGFPR